jgi:hypothetical protein
VSGARPGPVGLLWLLLVVGLPALGAAGFVVTRVETRPQDDRYVMDARVDFSFSDTALDALDNGVPLTIEVRVQVRSKGAWIWQRSLLDSRQLYSIRYQPLAELYQVSRLPDGPEVSFVTRAAAIDALGEIEGLNLLPRDRLDPGEQYEVRVKVSLDIEALPLPLRPMAYLRPSWDLSSGWTRWPLEP